MSKLYFEVLDPERLEAFQKLGEFKDRGILGGGTALALQIAHRKSYDFDVFTSFPIKKNLLYNVRETFGKETELLVDTESELSFLTPEEVKVSFLYFPFRPLHKMVETTSIPLLSMPDLASNKAYSIGRRGEYRDYVDLFFLLKRSLKFKRIIEEARKRFTGAFSEKLFLEQLTYFGDLEDFSVSFIDKSFTPEEILEFFKKEVASYIRI